MTFKTIILTTAALALSAGANAQTTDGAGAEVKAGASVGAPAGDALAPVADAVGAATDTQATAEAGAKTDLVAVTEADVKSGDVVRDTAGTVVGKVESVNAEGAVIATGKSRVQVPLTGFGKGAQGLVIAMTKAQLEAAAAPKPKS